MSTNVQTTITVAGNDQFSAMFGKLKQGADDVAKQAGKAADRTGAIGERAGNLERGFMGLKDVIGGVAEGPLAAIADRMGGIEAIVKGFGPGMGAVGLAIGAAAMGASLLYERLEAARKAGIQNQIDELSKAQADKALLAERYGLTREMLGLAEKATGLKGVQVDIDREVVRIASLEAEILKKKMDGETEGIARRESEISAGRERVSQLMRQVEVEKGLSAEADKRKATEMFIADNAGSLIQREREAELILDRKEQINRKTAIIDEKRAILAEKIKAAELAQSSILTRTVAGATELLGLREKMHGIEMDARALQDSAAADQAAKTAAAESAGQRWRDKRKAADEARRKAQDDYYAAENQLSEKLRTDAESRANEIVELQDKVRRNAVAAAESPAEKARLALADAQVRLDQESARIKEQLAGDDERRNLRLLDLEQRIATERATIRAAELRASEDAATKARAESAAKIDSAMGVASAAVAGLEQIGLAEQAAAGLKAVISAAEGGLALARGNYAGAVAGAFAAVQFGRVALGGGSGGGQASGGGQGGGMGTATASQQGSASGGQSGAVIINFNKGFYGDAASTAKGIAGTMKSLKGTGVAASKGA